MRNDEAKDSGMLKLPSVEEKRYEIKFDISEKYYHEDIKRYIFQPWDREELVISEIPEVVITTPDIWHVPDLLYRDIKHVEIRRLN
jgi:hypothetical protein